MEVAVAGVAPAAGLEPMTGTNLERPLDCLPQALEGHHDVLAELAAMPSGHGKGDAVAPAPDRPGRVLVGRCVDAEGPGPQHLDRLVADVCCLGVRAVGVCQHEKATSLGRAAG